MSLTPAEAIDDINGMILTAVGSTAEILWDDVEKPREKTEDPFIRFANRHAGGRQVTFGPIGQRMFERDGVSIASIYTPTGNGLSDSYALVKTIMDAFDGKHSPNGVWFKNVRLQEIGSEGAFHQMNVLFEFSYHEIK